MKIFKLFNSTTKHSMRLVVGEMVRYNNEQWNQNCPVLHFEHSSINKNSFATNSSGNALMSYYYLKAINFCEVANFTFCKDSFSRFRCFQFFWRSLIFVISVKIHKIREN